MQRLWCAGDSRLHSVVVARGPSRLTLDQIKLSGWVSLTSTILAILLGFGVLVWIGVGVTIYIIVPLLAVICCIWPLISNNRMMLDMYEGVRSDTNQSDDDERGANTIYQVWKTVRVTEPTGKLANSNCICFCCNIRYFSLRLPNLELKSGSATFGLQLRSSSSFFGHLSPYAWRIIPQSPSYSSFWHRSHSFGGTLTRWWFYRCLGRLRMLVTRQPLTKTSIA